MRAHPLNLSRQDGMSLIGVVVAVGVLTVFVVGGMTLMRNSFFLNRVVNAKEGHRDFKAAFQQAIVDEIRDYTRAPSARFGPNPRFCNGAFNFVDPELGSFGRVTLVDGAANPIPTLPAGPATANNRAAMVTSRNRCNGDPRLTPPAGSVSDFYFCVRIEGARNDGTSTALHGESFLNSPNAFAEVFVRMVDFQTGAGVTCQQFGDDTPLPGPQIIVAGLPQRDPGRANSAMGLIGYYSIHWLMRTGGETIYQRYNGSFNAAPNE